MWEHPFDQRKLASQISCWNACWGETCRKIKYFYCSWDVGLCIVGCSCCPLRIMWKCGHSWREKKMFVRGMCTSYSSWEECGWFNCLWNTILFVTVAELFVLFVVFVMLERNTRLKIVDFFDGLWIWWIRSGLVVIDCSILWLEGAEDRRSRCLHIIIIKSQNFR